MSRLAERPVSLPDFFAHIFAGKQPMAAADARRILKVRIEDKEQRRISKLLARNRESQITPEELVELDSSLNAANALNILHLKARLVLKNNRKPARHG